MCIRDRYGECTAQRCTPMNACGDCVVSPHAQMELQRWWEQVKIRIQKQSVIVILKVEISKLALTSPSLSIHSAHIFLQFFQKLAEVFYEYNALDLFQRFLSLAIVLGVPKDLLLEYTLPKTPDEILALINSFEIKTPKKRHSASRAARKRRSRIGWSEEEDHLLLDLVKRYGKKWGVISKYLKSKTPSQCGQHWRRVLSPGINKAQWSAQEDAVLMAAVAKKGKKWSAISRALRGRTDIQCRYRYYSLEKERKGEKRKRSNDSEEDLGPARKRGNNGSYPLHNQHILVPQPLPSRPPALGQGSFCPLPVSVYKYV
eukprot:TRINITY_DN11990_c0_g1_i1.p1 TRINITY_DN11990_c0_g1~~TRINITY_DN11990_c0_g1_i1.p1  ORF type:complete len:316 (-),score=30.19 TRINITY_DN11990_c0_g1_i1:63-1010(-)